MKITSEKLGSVIDRLQIEPSGRQEDIANAAIACPQIALLGSLLTGAAIHKDPRKISDKESRDIVRLVLLSLCSGIDIGIQLARSCDHGIQK